MSAWIIIWPQLCIHSHTASPSAWVVTPFREQNLPLYLELKIFSLGGSDSSRVKTQLHTIK